MYAQLPDVPYQRVDICHGSRPHLGGLTPGRLSWGTAAFIGHPGRSGPCPPAPGGDHGPAAPAGRNGRGSGPRAWRVELTVQTLPGGGCMAFESQPTPLGLTFLPLHRTNQMLSLALWLSGLSLDVSWWTGHVLMSGAGSLPGCEAGPTDPHGPWVAPHHTVSCIPRPHQHRGASTLAPLQGSGWRGSGGPEPAYGSRDSGLGSPGPAGPPGAVETSAWCHREPPLRALGKPATAVY